MTKETYQNYQDKATNGTLSDERNPIFILSSTHSDLLADVVAGKIDLLELAKRELANRGLNYNGEWVGFKKAFAEL